MSRVAIFVDAGYVHGRARRMRAQTGASSSPPPVRLDEEKLVSALRQFAEDKSHAELLRIYWYDGLPQTGMSAEHERLAVISDVKLRFGTISGAGNQKGVDSRIIADMIELARNRAIDSAVLLGGDDDLRVGVEVAGSYGVRFHLLGIRDRISISQAKLLQQEVDTVTIWERSDTAQFIQFEVTATLGAGAVIAPVRGDLAELYAAASIDVTVKLSDPTVAQIIHKTITAYISTLDDDTKGDIQTVYEARRQIEAPYDGRALAQCRNALGRGLRPDEKSFMRQELARLAKPSLPEP